MQFIEIDGLKIRYQIHRKAGAPKLLLTNALPMSIRCWDSHWAELSESFEMLAVDLPGFGMSDTRPDLLSPSAMSKFLAKIIKHFSWEDSIALGPDIGVPVVLSLAEQSPELLRGIVVFDGPGTYPPIFSIDLQLSMTSKLFRSIAKTFYFPGIYLKQVFARGYKTFYPSPEVYQEYLETASNPESFENAITFISTYPTELKAIDDKLGSIQLPTLILWGEKDTFVPPENGRQIHARIAGSKLHIFPGAGHFSHEDAGEAFTEVLRSFASL